MSHPNLNKPTNEQEICSFIVAWSRWFYDYADDYELRNRGAHDLTLPNGDEVVGLGLGTQLAYLWPAIVKGTHIEAYSEEPLVELLRKQRVPVYNAIWSYISIVNFEQ